MRIVRVETLPEIGPEQPGEGNVIYLHKRTEDGLDFMDIYATNTEGTQLVQLPTAESSAIHFGETAPSLPSRFPFWVCTSVDDFRFYVQYKDDFSIAWMDLQSFMATLVPEFDGTGVSNKMARSDHNHDNTYIRFGNHQW